MRGWLALLLCGSWAAWADDPLHTMQDVSITAAGHWERCPAAPAQPLTLAAAVDFALCQHPESRLAWANAKAQAAAWGLARAAEWPTLDAALSLSRQQPSAGDKPVAATTQSASLSLSYLLYDFGARTATIEAAHQRLLAENAAQESGLQNRYLAVVRAYLQWQANTAALEAARADETTAAESLRAAGLRHEVGRATPLERLQAEAALAQARLNRTKAEGALINSRAALADAMGLPAQTPLQPVAASERPTVAELPVEELDRWLSAAHRQRPDLIAADARWQAAQADLDAARAQGKPKVSLYASQGASKTTGSDWASPLTVGVSVSIPIFTGYADTYRARAAEAQLEASVASREVVRQQVSLEVVQAFNDLNTAAQAVSASELVEQSAEAAWRVAKGRYDAGLSSMLDLLQAQSTWANARSQTVEARRGWDLARFTLARAIGRVEQPFMSSGKAVLP